MTKMRGRKTNLPGTPGRYPSRTWACAWVLSLAALTGCGTSLDPIPPAGQSTLTGAGCDLRTAPYSVRQLSFTADDENNGWAPDSRHIAYADPADGRVKVYDTRTDTVATLTQPMGAEGPEWSADGKHIYFSTRPARPVGQRANLSYHTPPDMYVMNANGTGLRKIIVDSPVPSGPGVLYWDSTTPAKFSPDGRHVAFSTLQGVTSDTLSGLANASWVMLVGDLVNPGGTPRLVNVHPVNAPSHYWHEAKGFTRDGDDLMFGASTPDPRDGSAGNPDVYTLSLKTGRTTRYTANPAWEETMDVNPVYDDIVFNSDRANPVPPTQFALGTTAAHHDLYLAGPQGDAGWTRRLTTDGNPSQGGWASVRPRWSPDGREILFQQTQRTQNSITQLRDMLITFTCPASP
jgi:Tol biopolymer transport system component